MNETTAARWVARLVSSFTLMLPILVLLAVAAAACGSEAQNQTPGGEPASDTGVAERSTAVDGGTEPGAEDGAGSDSENSYFPVTLSTRSGDVVIAAKPTSIVSLSPTATEMLFAIDAGDSVSAVDRYSNYPPEAPEGTLDGILPDLDAVLSNQPDLVVAQDLSAEVMVGLAEADIPVILQPAANSLGEMYEQITELGAAVGHLDEAAAVNAAVKADVLSVLDELPELDEPVRVFHEIDDSFYTTTSSSFVGKVYQMMGFENVADPYDDGSGFPLVDGNAIVAANPTLIVVSKGQLSTYGADEIKARPGWEDVSAVVTGNVVEVDADIASGWGPRIVEFIQAVAAALAVQ